MTWHPLIGGLNSMSLSSHHFRVELSTEFLLRVHLIVSVLAGTEWYTEFWDYIFPWILTPHAQPNLMLVSITQEPSDNFDHEWLEGEDAKDEFDDYDFQMDEEEDEEDS